MDKEIVVSYPDSLAFSLKMGSDEFEREIKLISLVKLFELGKISSGVAAKALGISRVDFLDTLSMYHVSYFSNADSLESDLQNA